MKLVAFHICLFALMTIHAIDMILTETYIGNNWTQETFLPMSLSIKHFGIHISIWLSRLTMYPVFFLFLCKQKSIIYTRLLYIVTCLYYFSMLKWLITLNFITMP